MQSKTSFFNPTLFRKNLTRFAPVWGLYSLCLVVGLFMEYTNNSMSQFWFAYHLGQTIDVMAYVNGFYAFLVAQLLFGDLYTGRMCNMLHALPLRREGWFVTNLASAMVMSLVPTFIMTVASWALLANTIFQNAWVISLGVFLASNLEFIVFFGLATFATMCTGNRFAMAAGYGLLNFGARIVYFLINTVYTPMLYGVVTPMALMRKLTPLESLLWNDFFTTTTFRDISDDTGKILPGAVASFQFAQGWGTIFLWTFVGILFLALALVLYRKRHLECAGDAVAFPVLEPVFNVFCAVFVTAASVFVPRMVGMEKGTLVFLALGLAVGWFVGRMLLERSTRVFRLKNWYGLGILGLCLALTLGATKLDILSIEEYIPEAEKVEEVWLSSTGDSVTLEDPEDIQKVLRLQELALVDRLEDWGTYILPAEGGYIPYGEAEEMGFDLENEDYTWTRTGHINIVYTLKSGKEVTRQYSIWTETESGDIVRDLTSRWEVVNNHTYFVKGKEVNALDVTMENFRSFHFYESAKVPEDVLTDIDNAWGFIEAVKRDCEEGTMSQDNNYHIGSFRFKDESMEKGYQDMNQLWFTIYGDRYSWDIQFFPDNRHTVAYLQSLGLLDCEIILERQPLYEKAYYG